MGCHQKNTEYQKRWRELNRDKYLKQNVKGVLKYYYYKKGIKELMNIDPTIFLLKDCLGFFHKIFRDFVFKILLGKLKF